MTATILLPPDLEESLARLRTTDSAQLRRGAAALETTARVADAVSAGLDGVTAQAQTTWHGAAADTFAEYEFSLRHRLSEVSSALAAIARVLRSHAEATDEARVDAARGFDLAAALPPDLLGSLGSAGSPWQAEQHQQQRIDALGLLHRAAATFQTSERATRATLWSVGEQAPYGIPLPVLPPPAPRSGWQTALLGPADVQYWTAANGMRISVEPDGPAPHDVDTTRFDPTAPLYGVDEDGNVVPAFMADPSVGRDPDEPLECGSSVGLLLGFIATGAKSAKNVTAATEDMAALIRRSHGWRPEHMDRHLREFYRLKPGAVPEPWQRAEFLRTISAAGAKQGKVFTWRVPYDKGSTQATYAVLYNDPGTKRWVVVQFYKEGKRAREFATAFIPTEAQKAAMLEEIAIKP
jgi:uncharacterized protein YukE